MDTHAPVSASAVREISVFVLPGSPPEHVWSPVMPEVLNTDTVVRQIDDKGRVGNSAVCTCPWPMIKRSSSKFRCRAVTLTCQEQAASRAHPMMPCPRQRRLGLGFISTGRRSKWWPLPGQICGEMRFDRCKAQSKYQSPLANKGLANASNS